MIVIFLKIERFNIEILFQICDQMFYRALGLMKRTLEYTSRIKYFSSLNTFSNGSINLRS